MTDEPELISIALCTFNGERFLLRQLESLAAQTYRNLEIVVCDDRSSDSTLAILEQFATCEPRMRIVRNPSNLGFARNFPVALSECRGTLIAPCDQDDIWLPNKLRALADALGANALAYCDSTLVDESGTSQGPRMSQIVSMLSTRDPLVFALGNCVSGHAMLFRRSLLDTALPIPADFFYDWWIAAVAASRGGIVYCPESLVLYRQHGTNITNARLSEMMVDAGLVDRRVDGPRRSSIRGIKLADFRATGRRLNALAGLTGDADRSIAELSALWSSRERQWLSPVLAWRVACNRARLFPLAKLSDKKIKRMCRDLFWGLRWKRIVDAHGYSDTE